MESIRDIELSRYQKTLEGIKKKTEVPRKYYQIKKLVGQFMDYYAHLLCNVFEKILTGRGVDTWKVEQSYLMELREAYKIGLVNSELWIKMTEDKFFYDNCLHKELELKIYKRLPEYLKVMIEEIELWKDKYRWKKKQP